MGFVLPSRHEVYVSPLQPAAAEAALAAVVKPRLNWKQKFQMRNWRRDGKFMGEVGEGRFSLQRDINYRNSFLPFITGSIAPSQTGAGSDVTVDMKMHKLVTIFTGFWLLMVSFFAVVVLIAAANGKASLKPGEVFPLFIPFLMLAFGITLSQVCFRIEAKKAEKFLRSTLNAEVTAVQGRDQVL